MLEHKLNTQKKKFVAYREKALHLWKVTSQEPLSEFESMVMENNVKQLTLKASTLDMMHQLVNKLTVVFDEISELCGDTRREVVSLWRRLETPQEEQDVIKEQTTAITAKVSYVQWNLSNPTGLTNRSFVYRDYVFIEINTNCDQG